MAQFSSKAAAKSVSTKPASKIVAKTDPDFLRRFFAQMPEDDLELFTKQERENLAASFRDFMQTRKPHGVSLRIYTPRKTTDGWESHHTVIEINSDDMPFLVDSVTGELNRHGFAVHLVIHPVLHIVRDKQGKILRHEDAAKASAEAVAESCMQIHFDECLDAEELGRLEKDIRRVLNDVRLAVSDWRAIRAKISETIVDIMAPQNRRGTAHEAEEARDFLTWLDDNNFTFLGYRELTRGGAKGPTRLDAVAGKGLGILRDENTPLHDNLGLADGAPPKSLLLVTKSDRVATVHRTVPMDMVFVKKFDADGRVTGERVFLGLFTSASYTRTPREIPVLRQKVSRLLVQAGFNPTSHDGKALAHILDNYPRDELFQIADDELYHNAIGVLHLQERQRVALFVRRDPFNRFVSCLIYVPRENYDSALRGRFQNALEEVFAATTSSLNVRIDDSPLARVFLILRTQEKPTPDVDIDALEEKLREISRAWTDRLRGEMIERQGEAAGLAQFRRYGAAFPVAYRESVSPRAALGDITQIEKTLASQEVSIELAALPEGPVGLLHLKLFHTATPMALSDALPVIENMGLRVENVGGPYEIRVGNAKDAVYIHDFVARPEKDLTITFDAVKPLFEEAYGKITGGLMDDDGFNRLVLLAGLNWREVTLIRAFAKYLHQIRTPHTLTAMVATFAKHPRLTRLVVDLFLIRHDPAAQKDAAKRTTKIEDEVATLLAAVPVLDEDRIVRKFLNLVRASLRTNYFQRAEDGQPKSYLAIKFDSRAIDNMPLPRPMYEIFVHCRRVEAIHLRGGKVARGGIRWSDRKEDFRTEILGLVKAQMVKNSVIVPVGAKGGFIVKTSNPANMQTEGVECYKIMVRGLLDITDNRVNGKIVPPKDVVRHDGDDPYLVVAADKGTAKFSDIANSVSADYGFWLGDAFASGGSVGYDHKHMGITARGAWEAAKRHFREIGKDIQKEDFTCVGVGDMSGDVFGNGMLLSQHIRLIGAFDHRHIFCDPAPDAATSWKERKRLFELPSSSWADYSAKLISKGGGVFSRQDKMIKLTPEIRAAFDIAADSVTPAELIQAMLCAHVELLYFGGIGTYVKASAESHEDAGDRVNEALRVDGKDLRALVVAEGANLGVTQKGRVEYALKGGWINTDAIDNSAGVDTSDHEVNIKIALSTSVSAGSLTVAARNKLLTEMTDDVAELVLRDNYLQTQALSVAQAQAKDLLPVHMRIMRMLEKTGALNRKVEFLPDDEELDTRARNGLGLTRPELAVLLSYAKIWLSQQVQASSLPDDPFLAADLETYFPERMRKKHLDAIRGHQLRRDIITMTVTNSIVNRSGSHFVLTMTEAAGRSAADVTLAWLLTRDAFGFTALWQEIEALDNKVPAATQTAMMLMINDAMRYAVPWFLAHIRQEIKLDKMIPAYRAGVDALRTWLKKAPHDLMSGNDRQIEEALLQQGVPTALAVRVAQLPLLASAPDITELAASLKRSIEEAADIFFRVDRHFGFTWLRERAAQMPATTPWQREVIAALVEEMYETQRTLASAAMNGKTAKSKDKSPAALFAHWLDALGDRLAPVDQMLGEIRTVGVLDLSMMTLMGRHLAALAGKGR